MVGGHVREEPHISGRNARASSATRPARSASRMMPSHSAMMPTSGSADLHHRELRHLEALVGHLLEVVGAAADDDGEQDQPEPDVVEHRAEVI